MSTSLVILGCGKRKRRTSRLLPAIDRYDGPVFRVLRKHARETTENSTSACVLSGRFGLIPGTFPVPRYDHTLSQADYPGLRTRVERQLKCALDEIQPGRVFVSVGSRYWPLLEQPLVKEVASTRLAVATGSIGGRASQLAYWLRLGGDKGNDTLSQEACGEATLLGTKVRLGRLQICEVAHDALLTDPVPARRFETWCVAIGNERVAPKWLVSLLFDKPVARFRTTDARRVLSLLGVECIYARRH